MAFQKYGWDLLAFAGSIIGGIITYLGVKMTITSQREDRKVDKYYQDISVLYYIVNNTSFIKNVEIFECGEELEDGSYKVNISDTLAMQLDYIVDFMDIVQDKISDLIKSLDVDSFAVLDVNMKNLSGARLFVKEFDLYFRRDGENRMKERVSKYIDISEKIHKLIEDHMDDRTTEYLKIKKKTN
ncbi:hypothetical protein [Paenibacillus sp. TC-CSREp1]|uniref:hypothetical protein n=1 Tax=Paenibacillus sp. TC-CSREp1 TaxID=3410089 RepID=UPI003CEE7667